MKVPCSICSANPTEVPDGVQLGPGFRFACSECLPKGDATKPKAFVRRVRGDVGRDYSACTTTEEFLPQIRRMASAFASEYGLSLNDCLSEAKVALWEVEHKSENGGRPLTVRDAWAIARRAIFRFAERELAESGRVREVDSQNGRKGWKDLAYVVSFDEGWDDDGENENEDVIRLCEVIENAAAESPEEKAIKGEQERLLKQARRELPPQQRKILYLLYDEGLTVRETARVLRMSKSDVWRISAEAKAAIAKKLGTKPEISPISYSRGNYSPKSWLHKSPTALAITGQPSASRAQGSALTAID